MKIPGIQQMSANSYWGLVDNREAGSNTVPTPPPTPGEPYIGRSSHFLYVSLTQEDLQLVANSALGPEI